MNYQHYMLRRLLLLYLQGGLDETTRSRIQEAAEECVLRDWLLYIIEIAYQIGYARSALADGICETTYKNKKQLVCAHLFRVLSEVENESIKKT